jgi:hypothetical protein
MSLIFEGLRRNGRHQKQSVRTTLPPELPENISDLPMAVASLLPKTYSQTLPEPDASCITVDCSRGNDSLQKNDPVQIFHSEEQGGKNANGSLSIQTQAPKISNQSTEIQVPLNAERGQSENGLQRFPFVFEPQNSTKINRSPILRHKFIRGLIILESILVIPHKLLKFLCGTPLKSINFCSNWTALLLAKFWESMRTLGSVIANIFIKSAQLCHFIALRLPILGLAATGSFLKQQWSFLWECVTIGVNKLQAKARQGLAAIGSTFSFLLHCYRTVFNKALSIYLPNRWIQTATVFLLKGSAIALSCCFVVTIVKNALRSSALQNTGNSTDNIIALEKTPQRKLKHFFKDPLLVKREKVRDALLAFHIDTIQRHDNGKGQIITDNQTFGIGALLLEHPKVYLEKIGKNSLYFSDKYGQWYKRSIGNMLE